MLLTHFEVRYDDFGTELYAKFMPAEGLTLFAGWSHDENPEVAGFETDFDLFNFWGSYEVGGWVFAIEYNFFDVYGAEGNSGLLMAYYAVTDKIGITGRFGMEDWDDLPIDNVTWMISPSYKVSDNLLVLAEIKLTDWDDDLADDVMSHALEALFTF